MTTPLKRASDYFGSNTKLAEALGVTSQDISNWKKRGVPIKRAHQIQLATGFTVTAKELCPDIFSATDPLDPVFKESRGRG